MADQVGPIRRSPWIMDSYSGVSSTNNFSYLNLILELVIDVAGPVEQALLACTSRAHRALIYHTYPDLVWCGICYRDLYLNPLALPRDHAGNITPTFMVAHEAWQQAFNMYDWALVKRVALCWGRIKTWLEAQFPEALDTLRSGVSESELDTAEEALGVHLAHPTRMLFRLVDGQDLDPTNLEGSLFGLMGGQNRDNVYLLPLSEVIAHTPGHFHGNKVVVARSSNGKVFYLHRATGGLSTGSMDMYSIPCVPSELVVNGDGMLMWLEEHCRRLHDGSHRVLHKNNGIFIGLSPDDAQVYSASAHGILVRTSSKFVPSMCTFDTGSSWGYMCTIRMSLLGGCHAGGHIIPSCQLTQSHMIVSADGFDQAILDFMGPSISIPLLRPCVPFHGVSRQNPIVSVEREEVVYEYRAFLPASSGSIYGSLTFRPGSIEQPEGELIEVDIPYLPLQTPDYYYF